MKERIGEHYRLFMMKINGNKWYFIGEVNKKGALYVFHNAEQAVDKFEQLENAQ